LAAKGSADAKTIRDFALSGPFVAFFPIIADLAARFALPPWRGGSAERFRPGGDVGHEMALPFRCTEHQ